MAFGFGGGTRGAAAGGLVGGALGDPTGGAGSAWLGSQGGVPAWSEQYLDPLDMTGRSAARQRSNIEDQIARDRAFMKEQMEKRPEFGKGVLGWKGRLKKGMRSTAGMDVAGGLESRLEGIGAVGPGSRWAQTTRGLDVLGERAYGTETSPWAQKQLEMQAMQQRGAGQDIGRQAALGQAQQEARLAATGGLGAGARERLAGRSAQDVMGQRQQLAQMGQMQRLGIIGEDERQRMQLQQQLPGMELGAAGYESGLQERGQGRQLQGASIWGQGATAQAGRQQRAQEVDVANIMREQQARRDFEMGGWQSGLQAAMSGRQADVMARQGAPKGGFMQKLFG